MQDSIAYSADRADELMRSTVALRAAGLTLVPLTPFLGYRLYQGHWAISAIIACVMMALCAVVLYVRRGGSERNAMLVLVGVYSAGVVAAAYTLGFAGMVWLYPLLAANFFCLPRGSATTVNLICVGAILPVLYQDPYMGSRVLAALGLVFLFGWVFSRQLDQQRRQLARLALQDPLTGVGNRRALDYALERARYRLDRYQRPTSLIVLDLDHFKRINDELGHHVGDEVLARIAGFLRGRLRESDRLYRFGGEEFVIVMPETSEASAATVADELRRNCNAIEVAGVEALTFSAGTAELAAGESEAEWLGRADAALYRAKAAGRNRVLAANLPGA